MSPDAPVYTMRKRIALIVVLAILAVGIFSWPIAMAQTVEAKSAEKAALPILLDKDQIVHRGGLAFAISLSISVDEADSMESNRHSKWLLYEDDIQIGIPHTSHDFIEQNGGGTYSHWKSGLVFSTPDGSDPRINGRVYTLQRSADRIKSIFAPDAGRPIVLREDESLDLKADDIERMERISRTGSSLHREIVNPIDGENGLQFPGIGEYDISSTAYGPIRCLVVPTDRMLAAELIVQFAAAHMTGGTTDVPSGIGTTQTWTQVDARVMKAVFRSDDSIDLNCGFASRFAQICMDEVGIPCRYVWWIGDDTQYDAHVGLEVRMENGAWVYFDPHIGFRFEHAWSALEGQFALNNSEFDLPREWFRPLLINELWMERALIPTFRSIRHALRIEGENGVGTAGDPTARLCLTLVFGDTSALVQTEDSMPAHCEVLHASNSDDVVRFHETFYAIPNPAAPIINEESADPTPDDNR